VDQTEWRFPLFSLACHEPSIEYSAQDGLPTFRDVTAENNVMNDTAKWCQAQSLHQSTEQGSSTGPLPLASTVDFTGTAALGTSTHTPLSHPPVRNTARHFNYSKNTYKT
jgi:hypothetical protein